MHLSRLTKIVLAVGGVLAASAGVLLCWPGDREGPDLTQARLAIERKDYDAVVAMVRAQPPSQAKPYVRCLGLQLGAQAQPVLTRLLDPRVEGRDDVRAWSASALNATIGPDAPKDPATGAVKALVMAMREDPAPQVRASAATTLGYTRTYQTMGDLFEALDDPNPAVRQAAGRAVEKITRLRLHYRSDAPESDRKEQIRRLKLWWGDPQNRGMVASYYDGGRFKAIYRKYSR